MEVAYRYDELNSWFAGDVIYRSDFGRLTSSGQLRHPLADPRLALRSGTPAAYALLAGTCLTPLTPSWALFETAPAARLVVYNVQSALWIALLAFPGDHARTPAVAMRVARDVPAFVLIDGTTQPRDSASGNGHKRSVT